MNFHCSSDFLQSVIFCVFYCIGWLPNFSALTFTFNSEVTLRKFISLEYTPCYVYQLIMTYFTANIFFKIIAQFAFCG